MTERVWQYEFEVDYVYDGDTIMGDLDMGLGHHLRPVSLRLLGINAPEMRGGTEKTKAAAAASKLNLTMLAPRGSVLEVESHHWDKYSNRIDAIVYAQDDPESLNMKQLNGGFAVVYMPE